MWPQFVVEVCPGFSRLQELANCVVPLSSYDSVLECTDKAFSVGVVSWRAGPAHAWRELVGHEYFQCFSCSVLRTLVRVEDVVVLGGLHKVRSVKSCCDQLGPHTVVEDQTEYLPVTVVQDKTTAYLAAVSQPELKDV